MDEIVIEGGVPLRGEIAVSGSKNAVLPLMVAGLLTDEKLVLRGTPRLADTRTLAKVLGELGAAVEEFGDGPGEGVSVQATDLVSTRAPYEWVSKMRASFWVLGPLLARAHQAQVSLPGGCAIGTRPVDLYLNGLEAMGADIVVEGGYVNATAKGGLKAARVDFPFVSVGATHVLMMAACLAKGTSVITNAASEPEVVDVGTCLQAMGAKIDGLGTRTLTIDGVARLSGADHTVTRDRIEAGAFALAVAATHGDVTLTGIDENLLGALAPAMRLAGAELSETGTGLHVKGPRGRAIATPVTTEPYPGFATDLQAPFMGLMCCADGVSRIRETIFENRFMHVQELARLGADISLEGDTAIVTGVEKLFGAPVMATDLRASVTLVIAGLMAEGQTRIARVYHLDRGYERIEEKLSAVGAKIWRESQ
ncbi:MAG: UDP-N-acetylglucosamine 1-carboxyvinyltransferase [PS1 clade bacterium]|uniref:UDP-N-acetylglucosamine 1-carboxyvinyltransferase n=1 Tax=PS1 clade bacterium TaxID=2175152 RepID=A0A937HJY3_9PROT|nr:UDP-N-acetylglucosamine 1-carboxyvinyltransferase [PS1 clade bacterium]